MPAAGGPATQLTDNTATPSEADPTALENIDDGAPAVSPDGRRIAFTSNRPAPDGSTDNEIYLMDLDGRNIGRLTDNPSGPPETNAEYDPAWSPDGTKIAFRRGEGRRPTCGSSTSRRASSDASTSRPARALAPSTDSPSAWSPDGQRIAFRKGNGQGSAIGVYDLVGDRPFELIDQDALAESCPAWSPDGRMIAFRAATRAAAQASGSQPPTAAPSGRSRRPGYVSRTVSRTRTSVPHGRPTDDGSPFRARATASASGGADAGPRSDGLRGGAGRLWRWPGRRRPGRRRRGDDPGNVELYVMNADGTDETRLTADTDPVADRGTSPSTGSRSAPSSRGPRALRVGPTGAPRAVGDGGRMPQPARRPHPRVAAVPSEPDRARERLPARRCAPRPVSGVPAVTASVDLRGRPRGR